MHRILIVEIYFKLNLDLQNHVEIWLFFKKLCTSNVQNYVNYLSNCTSVEYSTLFEKFCMLNMQNFKHSSKNCIFKKYNIM